MAHVTKPNVAQTSTTGGTGDLALTDSVDGQRDFGDVMADQDTAIVQIRESLDDPDWETTEVTYNSGAGTLSRAATPIASSNAGSKVDFTAGVSKVIAMVAEPSSVSVTRAVLSPSQVTANQDDWSPTGFDTETSWLRVDTDASRDFTGLAAGAPGQTVAWTNAGSNPQVLAHQDTGSAAANRFLLAAAADLTLGAGDTVWLRYDPTSERWRDLATHRGAMTFASSIATTSGTAHDLTGIPTDTTYIRLVLDDVGFSTADELAIELGDSGGFESSAYDAAAGGINNSNTSAYGASGVNFLISLQQGASDVHGVVQLFRANATSNTWSILATTWQNDGSVPLINYAGGTKTLSGNLTQVRLRSLDGATFNSGTLYPAYATE